jgi:hypothetical protein
MAQAGCMTAAHCMGKEEPLTCQDLKPRGQRLDCLPFPGYARTDLPPISMVSNPTRVGGVNGFRRSEKWKLEVRVCYVRTFEFAGLLISQLKRLGKETASLPLYSKGNPLREVPISIFIARYKQDQRTTPSQKKEP